MVNAPDWTKLDVGTLVVDAGHLPDERQLFLFSSATHNAHRIHYDLPYAQSEGYPALLVHGPLQRALMARFIMDWAGSSARLIRLELQHRSPAFVGEPIQFRAQVAGMRSAETTPDAGEVDLSLSALSGDRLLMRGSAAVRLAFINAA